MPQVMRHTVCLAYALVTLSAYPQLQVLSNTLARRSDRQCRLEEACELGVDHLVPFKFVTDTGAAKRNPEARGGHRIRYRRGGQERIQQPM